MFQIRDGQHQQAKPGDGEVMAEANQIQNGEWAMFFGWTEHGTY